MSGSVPRAPVGRAAPADLPDLSVLAALRAGRFDPGRRGVLALVGVAMVAAVLAGVLLLRGRPTDQPVELLAVAGAGTTSPTVPVGRQSVGPSSRLPGGPAADVVVDVGGRVHRPGLVHLPVGSRVDDAIRAAGGPLSGTDLGVLNLARLLVDGEQVLVGAPSSVAGETVPGSRPAPSAGGPLDLNVAEVGDFDALPGIGPVLAQRLVDWRTAHGRFASVDQLREVSGIGEAKYQSLKSKVRV